MINKTFIWTFRVCWFCFSIFWGSFDLSNTHTWNKSWHFSDFQARFGMYNIFFIFNEKLIREGERKYIGKLNQNKCAPFIESDDRRRLGRRPKGKIENQTKHLMMLVWWWWRWWRSDDNRQLATATKQWQHQYDVNPWEWSRLIRQC